MSGGFFLPKAAALLLTSSGMSASFVFVFFAEEEVFLGKGAPSGIESNGVFLKACSVLRSTLESLMGSSMSLLLSLLFMSGTIKRALVEGFCEKRLKLCQIVRQVKKVFDFFLENGFFPS